MFLLTSRILLRYLRFRRHMRRFAVTVACLLCLHGVAACVRVSPHPEQRPVATFEWMGHGGGFTQWGQGGKYLYGESLEPSVLTIWEWEGDTLKAREPLDLGGVFSVACAAGDRIVARGAIEREGHLSVFDFNGKELKRTSITREWTCRVERPSRAGRYIALTGSPDWENPEFGGPGRKVRVGLLAAPYDTAVDWTPLFSFRGGFVGMAIPSDDGAYVAVASVENGAAVVDMKDHRLLWMKRPPREVNMSALAFSPDGQRLYGGGSEGALYCMDTQTGEVLSRWVVGASGGAQSGSRITIIDVSRDGRLVVAGAFDGVAYVFDTESGNVVTRLAHGGGPIALAQFSPDSNRLATFVFGSIKIWELPKRRGRNVDEPRRCGANGATAPRTAAPVGAAERPETQADHASPWNLPPDAPPPAVAPFSEQQARRHQDAWAEHLGKPREITNSIGMKLVLIPPGEFMMGSPEDEEGRWEDEGPQHRVRITKPFYFGLYQVTQEEYGRVMGRNPSWFSRGGRGSDGVSGLDTSRFPVENVSWNDAMGFCRKLSALPAERSAGREYRLPTEAEWEYACRAGTTTRYSFGHDASQLGDYAWYHDNSDRRTHPVGQKQANPWALYDLYGNLWEWCSDWFSSDYYANSPADDPNGPAWGSGRVLRGGGWVTYACAIRSANRHTMAPDDQYKFMGFRVVLVPADESSK